MQGKRGIVKIMFLLFFREAEIGKEFYYVDDCGKLLTISEKKSTFYLKFLRIAVTTPCKCEKYLKQCILMHTSR
jgi:hypothetical protein